MRNMGLMLAFHNGGYGKVEMLMAELSHAGRPGWLIRRAPVWAVDTA
jgi:hypothetical protein